jgi:hypothetical protein
VLQINIDKQDNILKENKVPVAGQGLVVHSCNSSYLGGKIGGFQFEVNPDKN